jgi:Lipocalin-like domain
MANSKSNVVGTWKLLSLDVEFQASGERQQPYGPNPDGYLILTPEGRTMAVVAAKGRKPGLKVEEQAELLRTLLAYTGTYKLSGNKFITKVDVSWNQAWTGTEQERFFEVQDDRLTIVTAWLPNPNLPGGPIVRGSLTFERAK